MSITAKELAQRLGLSATAVSMALNNKPGVSTQTKAMILEEAEKCGYDFSKLAMKQNNQGYIYVIVYRSRNATMFYNQIYDDILMGFESKCLKSGYKMKLEYFYERNLDIQRYIEDFRTSDCKGFILLGTDIRFEYAKRLLSMPFPGILVDAYFEQLNCNCVLINNIQGAYLATDYLINRCDKQPGYLQSSYPLRNFEERMQGFLNAVKDNSMSPSRCIVHRLTPSIDGAMADMLEIIDRGDELAGCYFSDNDLIAIGVVKALQLRNYNVPDDISIIGFDNIPECKILNPSLTTIKIPWNYMGQLAGQHLISIIESPSQHLCKIEVSTTLVKRFSA